VKLFLIADDEDGPIYVFAEDMGEAIGKWQRWCVSQSDGADLGADLIDRFFPPNIAELEGEIIR
jgi:hypothetical protein